MSGKDSTPKEFDTGGYVAGAVGVLSDGAPLRIRLSDGDLRLFDALAAPVRMWTSPRFYGLDNIPDSGPVLLVGNHTLLGGVDAPLLLHEILHRRGRLVRGLAENVLMRVPAVRDLVHRMGSVRGNRANCRALLASGEAVIVFPGGGREAMRRKGEKYVLKWEGRTGFARMAIEAGAPVLPVAMIGADDVYDVVFDGDHPVMRPLRWAVEALGIRRELTPPLMRGLGPTLLPRPERFYYSVGTPIDTAPWRDTDDPDSAAAELQVVVRKALQEELTFLLGERDRDGGRTLWGRVRETVGL
ncbi:lysophospholipid acyltransferase family protein [Nocardia terpenica]|uniref:lysophospholipid acyltransferase family protein n=1 Tax=Nocardia terpenica TaxID=455432 RepID=UPI001E37B0D4|nr:lysophospholipid acyltransferase family protein [Nocardia terpenica]